VALILEQNPFSLKSVEENIVLGNVSINRTKRGKPYNVFFAEGKPIVLGKNCNNRKVENIFVANRARQSGETQFLLVLSMPIGFMAGHLIKACF